MKKQNLLFLFFLLTSCSAWAADVFKYMSMTDVPLSVSLPVWSEMQSKLSFGYEVNEAYKKWLDGVKVADFSGHSFREAYQYKINERFTAGASFINGGKQKWKNKEKKEMSVFNFDSGSSTDEFFVKYSDEYFSAVLGKGRAKDELEGSYHLHKDIVSALGANPEIFFDTDTDYTYWRLYKEHKKAKLLIGGEKSQIDHEIYTETPAMKLTLNLNRKVYEKFAEMSYEVNSQWAPYFRRYQYKDLGAGTNYRSDVYEVGNNGMHFKSAVSTFGTAYTRKNADYWLDYSKISLKASANTFFNLGNIEPLFLFSSGPIAVDYNVKYSPEEVRMARFGLKRHYRQTNYFLQYSLTKLVGDTTQHSLKRYSPFFSTPDFEESKTKKRSTRMHRFDFTLKAPTNKGHWVYKLNLLAPITKTLRKGSSDGKTTPKPDKDIRGGWQLIIAREFNF